MFVFDLKLLLDHGVSVTKLQSLDFQSRNINRALRPGSFDNLINLGRITEETRVILPDELKSRPRGMPVFPLCRRCRCRRSPPGSYSRHSHHPLSHKNALFRLLLDCIFMKAFSRISNKTKPKQELHIFP